ncbi:hypothetical protein HaLaN_31024, partial [Haematococcus lacustris]
EAGRGAASSWGWSAAWRRPLGGWAATSPSCTCTMMWTRPAAQNRPHRSLTGFGTFC